MNTLVAVAMPPWLTDGTAMLLTRLGLNLVFTTIVVRLVYYRLYKSREYVFTYFLINIVTFTLAHLLSTVRIELGFALGLFAVFGIDFRFSFHGLVGSLFLSFVNFEQVR